METTIIIGYIGTIGNGGENGNYYNNWLYRDY